MCLVRGGFIRASGIWLREDSTMAVLIRNPFEWLLDQFGVAGHTIEETGRLIGGKEAGRCAAPPVVRRISIGDLRDVIRKGVADFAAFRTDVIALCVIYP